MSRLDINEGIKLYRTSTSNSLASLSLLFDGTLTRLRPSMRVIHCNRSAMQLSHAVILRRCRSSTLHSRTCSILQLQGLAERNGLEAALRLAADGVAAQRD